MATVNLRNNRLAIPLPRKPPHNAPRMVSASASLRAAGRASNDKSASFGQRRQRSSSTYHTTRESGLQKTEEGGSSLSWIPSKTKSSSKELASARSTL